MLRVEEDSGQARIQKAALHVNPRRAPPSFKLRHLRVDRRSVRGLKNIPLFYRMTPDDIRTARKLRKLTQAALGKLTKLTASEISRIECGYRDLSTVEAAAIASALGLTKAAVSEPVAPAPVVAVGMAAASQVKLSTDVDQPRAAASSSANVPAAAKGIPSGSDLKDPANFGVLPDLALLGSEGSFDESLRAQLSAELARATTILHTPRVPPAVWRAWRQFEQQAMERLRNSSVVAPVPAPVPAAIPAPVKPTEKIAAPVPESKSLNSLFVEAARELLPGEVVERINQAAERGRQEDPSMGFMKHFRRIAETELDAGSLKRVTDEATRRIAPERWRTRRGRGSRAKQLSKV